MDDIELERIKHKKLMKSASPLKQAALNKPVKVNETVFDEFVRKHRLIVVDCWAEWCLPCKLLEPVIEKLTEIYAGRVVFAKLNVDENPALTARYFIDAIPTLLIFKNGEYLDRVVGYRPLEELNRIIASCL